jgi:pimeloyl-ACP methyl ester carboxylesterase
MTALVLVHGGSVTSRSWDGLLPALATPAHTVDLPGRRHRPADLGTLHRTDWEASAADDIAALGLDQLVLVGHSSGGYVIPGVAARLPAGMVRHLVFVAGTCPAEGDRPVDAMTPRLRAIALDNQDRLVPAAAGRTLGDLRPGEPPIETELEIVEVRAAMGVEAPLQLFDPMTWVGVPDVPRTYIRAMGDRVIPPDHALRMAANAGADTIIDIDATHDVAASAPQALATILDRIVENLDR